MWMIFEPVGLDSIEQMNQVLASEGTVYGDRIETRNERGVFVECGRTEHVLTRAGIAIIAPALDRFQPAE